MNELFEILAVKSIGTSFLIVLIILLRFYALKYLSASFSYRLWLIIPIFLLLPPAFITEAQIIQPVQINVLPSTDFVANAETDNQNLFNAIDYLILVWAIGFVFSIVLLIKQLYSLKNFSKDVNVEVYQRIKGLVPNAMFPSNLKIVTNEELSIPCVFGIFTRYLVITDDFKKLSNSRQELVIRHELQHIKQFDYLANLIYVILVSVFWFNPLMYLAGRYFRADQEMSCDARVLEELDRNQIREYGEVVFDYTVESNVPVAVSAWQHKSMIKERLIMLNRNYRGKYNSLVWLVIMFSSIWATNIVIAVDDKNTIGEEAKPIVITNPVYPKIAIENKIDGWVRFNFNIASDGKPFDIKLVGAEPKNIFEESASNAIQNWKFKPEIVNGEAVEQRNMHYKITFKSEEPNISKRSNKAVLVDEIFGTLYKDNSGGLQVSIGDKNTGEKVRGWIVKGRDGKFRIVRRTDNKE